MVIVADPELTTGENNRFGGWTDRPGPRPRFSRPPGPEIDLDIDPSEAHRPGTGRELSLICFFDIDTIEWRDNLIG